YYNHPDKECSCGSIVVQRYLNKVSGPLLDRIDLHVEVTPVNYDELANDVPKEGSEEIRNRVMKARLIQIKRFSATQAEEQPERIYSNAEMGSRAIKEHCQIDTESAEILKRAMNTLGFSARAYDRILKVSRTIADLD